MIGIIKGRHGDDEIIVNMADVANARYSCTLGHESKLVLTLLSRGIVPNPAQPGNVMVLNSRLEFRGLDADQLWDQMRRQTSLDGMT